MMSTEKLVLVQNKVVTIQVKKLERVNRSQIFQIYQILNILRKEKPLISVVTRYANICHQKTSEFLDTFNEMGLVTKTPNKDYVHKLSFEYKLTDKGYKLLNTLEICNESLKEFNLEL